MPNGRSTEQLQGDSSVDIDSSLSMDSFWVFLVAFLCSIFGILWSLHLLESIRVAARTEVARAG